MSWERSISKLSYIEKGRGGEGTIPLSYKSQIPLSLAPSLPFFRIDCLGRRMTILAEGWYYMLFRALRRVSEGKGRESLLVRLKIERRAEGAES